MFNLKDKSLKARHAFEDATADKSQSKVCRSKIVDQQLADIVMVKKNEIEEWQQRQQKLRYDIALTKKKVEMKLKECKKRFERQYVEIER